MARPNQGKRANSIVWRTSPNLQKLIHSFRQILQTDGQKFAHKASDSEIAEMFIEHYWRVSAFTNIGKKMRVAFFKNVTKSNQNI